MITGVVQAREGRIRLEVRGPRRQQREIKAVIDTGYTASLSLPPGLVVSLGLRWKSFGRGLLADGRECLFDVYVAKVVWDGKERRILGHAVMWRRRHNARSARSCAVPCAIEGPSDDLLDVDLLPLS